MLSRPLSPLVLRDAPCVARKVGRSRNGDLAMVVRFTLWMPKLRSTTKS